MQHPVVTIISHKTDAASRTELIAAFSEKPHAIPPFIGRYCTFELETRHAVVQVQVIGDDWSPSHKIDDRTIVFIDVGTGSAKGKRMWAERIAARTGAEIWEFAHYDKRTPRMIIGDRRVVLNSRLDYEWLWHKYLERTYDLFDPIQTTIELFQRVRD